MSSLPLIVKYIIVAFVSMVPIVELRGAIPIAEGLGLNIFLYYPIAIIFNMLPVPIIYLFARKVLEWGKDKKIIGRFFTWCLEKGEKGGKKLKETAGNKGIFFALLLFVGIPLPGTGAWTGTLAASFLNLDFKTSVSAVALGVILAGIIMLFLGLLGEYIGRIYICINNSPQYAVRETINIENRAYQHTEEQYMKIV